MHRQKSDSAAPVDSLIPQTLEDMEADVDFQQHLKSLAAKGQAALTREERLKRQRSLDSLGVPSFYAVAQVRVGMRQ
eukprot:1158876-Pelagomonas_calceolata.AAC.1